jgi:hypothetical protein
MRQGISDFLDRTTERPTTSYRSREILKPAFAVSELCVYRPIAGHFSLNIVRFEFFPL